MAHKSIASIPTEDRIRVEKHFKGTAQGWAREWTNYIVYGPIGAIIAAGICNESQIPACKKRIASFWVENENGLPRTFIGVTKKLNSHLRVVFDEPKGALKIKLESLITENESKPRSHLRLVWSAPA